MNKERAFTLIELLAVIVILAIIALISTPIIVGVIDKSRKGAFEDSAYGILEAGRIYFIDALAAENKFTGATFVFSNKTGLKVSGEIPTGGSLVLNDSGKSAMALYDKDKKWCALKNYDEEKITIKDYKEDECVIPLIGGMRQIVQNGVVKEGEGLYQDTTSSGGYLYKGANPDNFFLFDGKCFSLVRMDLHGIGKLIYEGNAQSNQCVGVRTLGGGDIGTLSWNALSINNWYDENTTIRNVLEALGRGESYGGFQIGALDNVLSQKWYVGALSYVEGQTLEEDIRQEKSGKLTGLAGKDEYIWENKIGLLNMSDYVKASTYSGCTSFATSHVRANETEYNCQIDNYLFKNVNPSWLLNPYAMDSMSATSSSCYGLGTWADSAFPRALRPTLYVRLDRSVTGKGTPESPYTLVST